MGNENALRFIESLDDMQGTHSNYYISLPHQPSLIYRYLFCIGKGVEDFLVSYRGFMSHCGFLMITYGDEQLGRVRGMEVATFMYSFKGGRLLDYLGYRAIPPEPEEFLIQETSPSYYEYLECCHFLNNWFFHLNKSNKEELLRLYQESEVLSNNIVLEYVFRGLERKPYLTEREIKSLFRGLFPSSLHFYRIDLGKDTVKEIS